MVTQGPAVSIDIPVLIPYEVMHALYLQGERQFTLSMLGEGGAEGIKAFWKDAVREEWVKHHPKVPAQCSAMADMIRL